MRPNSLSTVRKIGLIQGAANFIKIGVDFVEVVVKTGPRNAVHVRVLYFAAHPADDKINPGMPLRILIVFESAKMSMQLIE